MTPISFKRHRFKPDTIRLAVWLYFRFTTSLRDVEEMLAERGIDVRYETIRCWANKFGPAIVANIRRRRPRADCVWHLDESVPRGSHSDVGCRAARKMRVGPLEADRQG